MGASVRGYWEGITEEQSEAQFGFDNDCKAWGDWMAERLNHPDVLKTLEQLGLSAVLTHTTDGMDWADVDWVSPDELMDAASRLRELVLARDPRVARVVETYTLSCPDFGYDEFAQDLKDVGLIARCAKEEGVKEMTLEVNW